MSGGDSSPATNGFSRAGSPFGTAGESPGGIGVGPGE